MSEEILLNTYPIQHNCYECDKLDTSLVKACNNENCEAYYHQETAASIVAKN